MSFAVLEALAWPATVAELAARLDVAPPHLRLELARLERRGYVRSLGCATSACGWCALRAGCGATTGAERWVRA